MKKRCQWSDNSFEAYVKYHDEEWGVPVHDDKVHFEFLVLEGAQAGLSWSTVLKKREGYRKAFADFDVNKIIKFKEPEINQLLVNPEIIRNRLKIHSVVNNAFRFKEIQSEFGSFDKYIWSFVNDKPIVNHWKELKEIPAKTEVSDKLSKDLLKRGFKFVGSTIIYSHMQACGLVNDHTVDCFRHDEIVKKHT